MVNLYIEDLLHQAGISWRDRLSRFRLMAYGGLIAVAAGQGQEPTFAQPDPVDMPLP